MSRSQKPLASAASARFWLDAAYSSWSRRIAAYKYPRVVHLVETLPLGGSGEVLKRELVEQYSTSAAEPVAR